MIKKHRNIAVKQKSTGSRYLIRNCGVTAMDAATMVAINNLNMLTVMSAMQQTQNFITIIDSEKEYEDMSGSMLDQYVGRDCVVSLFNEVGAIKGRFVEADAQWVKVETPKKGTQLINRNMIRNITFDNK